MATLSDIRTAIAATIAANVAGLEVYGRVPDVIHTPAVVVEPAAADFNVAMGRGTDTWTFALYVLCARTVATEGQDQLDVYVTGAGDSSLREIIFENRTLGLAAGALDASISGMSDYGATFESAGIPHVGAVLTLIVHTNGTI